VVEDNPSDRRRLVDVLTQAGLQPSDISLADSLTAARRHMATGAPDCILLDLSLPDAMGLEGVAIVIRSAPGVPVVVLTEQPADARVYLALAEGAEEYLWKGDLSAPLVEDVLTRAVVRRHSGENIQRHTATASVVLDAIDAPTVAIDASGRIVAVNHAWASAGACRGATLDAVGIGVNYLAVCDQAVGSFSEGAAQAAAGIRAVLNGEEERFAVDYPCAGDEGDEWFSLRATSTGELGGGAVLIHLDITPLKRAELVMRQQEARLHSVFDESAPIFAMVDRDGTVLDVSDLTADLLGVQAHDRIGLRVFDSVHAADLGRATEVFERVLGEPGMSERIEVRILDGQGRWREVDVAIANLLEDPKIAAVTVTGCDVTEGRFNQIARRLESRLLQQLPAAVAVTDERGVVVYWNDRAAALFGYSAGEVLGHAVAEFGIAPTRATTDDNLRVIATTGRWEGDFEAVRRDGSIIPIHTTLERVEDREIGFRGVVAASVDIHERRELEQSLAFQALHDSVTELPNRRLFVQHLETALSRSRRTGKTTAVLFIDIDDFKLVNDRMGHVGGDSVLRAVGRHIGGVLRSGDIVARLGGDEFVVCCDDLDTPDRAGMVAERIIGVLAEPLEVGSESARTTASIGIALSGEDSSAEGLLRNADIAMYAAKQAGKARVEVFDDALHARVRSRNELAIELDLAIDLGQIETLFQPEVDLVDGSLVGFEALARWTHPERGPVSPVEFIPIAEECGLIGRLGRVVMEDACRALRSWLDISPDGHIKVAVNVSARQLSDPGFPTMVRDVLVETGAPASGLCVEVTESTLIDVDVAAAALWRLNEEGIEIAIDDFGTGYSSLSRLHRFPLDYLKIDRSFVAGMCEHREDVVIVSCVLALAKGLGVRAIAEGIESGAQLEQLAAAGCEMGQGWLWSPAVPVGEALALVGAAGPVPVATPRAQP
jgi:diguanylate cyclase (GGDEF)-like protein/PAS domain S-box-containing protein